MIPLIDAIASTIHAVDTLRTQNTTRCTQQSTTIILKAAAANLIWSSSRMDEGQAEPEMMIDDGMSAHYHRLHGPVLQLLAQEEVAH
jgi:hypothetical protein